MKDAVPLDEPLELLQKGEIVAFPTETFYGLGVDPRNQKAVSALCDLKARPEDQGILLIISDAKSVEELIEPEAPDIRTQRLELQRTFWPGPLTLVISPNERTKNVFGKGIFASDGSLAVRVSPEQVARKLAQGIGGAITAPSANPRAEAPARSAEEVREYFPELYIVKREEGVGASNDAPSTILDVRCCPCRVVREGVIKAGELGM